LIFLYAINVDLHHFTGFAVSVVPAFTCTGEGKLSPFIGVQMVTDGDAVLRRAGSGSASERKVGEKTNEQ